jgi:predicted TIM-barrel fold metal-dependent hydrolase
MSELIVSADSHVVEPGDLWFDRLPAEFRTHAPHRRMRDDGMVEFVVEANGEFVTVTTSKPDNSLQDAGSVEKQPDKESGYNAKRRLEDVERDGIWAEILYPTTGLFAWSMTDPALSFACAQVYNDWVSETFAEASDRFVCGAMIPIDDLGAALAEVKRARTLGFRSIMLPMIPPPNQPYFLEDYDPIWAEAQAAGMPVTFHVITGMSAADVQGYDIERVPPAVLSGGQVTVTFPAPVLLIQTVMSGVFERFPDLHMVLVETGTGWLAWVMEELDKSAENDVVPYPLPKLPSEYIREQVHCTFMDDRVGLNNINATGARSLLWGSDYPHAEGTWPHSQREIERVFQGISAADRAAITGGTAAEIFRVPLPIS